MHNKNAVSTSGYAAYATNTPLRPIQFERRVPGDSDVQIDILFCGVCHSDLHSFNGDWGPVSSPLVPGHEIVGRVERVGAKVTQYKVGDLVGVGCLVDSCRSCSACEQDLEQYCEVGGTYTYGAPDKKSGGITQGGYSTKIVVDEKFVLRIPKNLPLDRVAPLLCAGITTYSPLRHWKVGKGSKVAVAGLGGLGHMAVKLATAMGAEVTVLSTSEGKRKDAKQLGALDFAVVGDEAQYKKWIGKFDFIVNTISADHDYNQYLNLLKLDGTMVLLGVPKPQKVAAGALIGKRRQLAGSLIGGIAETQEMLNFCGEHNISSDIEVIPMSAINEAFVRMVKGDVHYRFVIDLQSLK